MQTCRDVAVGRRGVGAALMACLVASGCADPLRMESKLDGELMTVVRLEGPVRVELGEIRLTTQMQGPTIEYQGTYVSEELYDRVKVGETTDDWILAVLGEPDGKAPLRDGTEVWRWTYYPIEQQTALVEVFGGGGDKKPKLATRGVFLQMRQGLVIEKWKG